MKKILFLTLLVCQSVAIMAADNWVKVGNLWYWYNDAKTTAAVVPARNSETYTGLSDEITIPASIDVDETPIPVTEIRANTFQGCTNITSVVINAAITQIFPNCFKGCSQLSTINIPVGVTEIKLSAFQNCTSLGVLTLPEGLTTIGSNAFNGCTGMTEVNIPESMSSIDGAAFTGCSSLRKVNFASYESLCAITFYNANSNPLNNTTAELWIGGTKQTSLKIPASITTIKQYAFAGLNSVSSVDFSEVTGSLTIAKDAFVNNSGYDKVIFKKGAKEQEAEQLCSMNYASLSSNPLYFGHHLYYSDNLDTEIKTISIPKECLNAENKVRPYLFAGATDMTRVYFPVEATATTTGAFKDCTSIEYVGFPTPESFDNIKWEDNDANPFYASGKAVPLVNGAPLESLTLSDDVTPGKYQNAKWLTSVIFNAGVTEIGAQAFMGCSNLTTVTIEGAVITTIGKKAFHGCQKLGYFELPNSLTSIGEEAFRNCEKFTSVTIPAGCTLGDGAFVWCTQLKTATINSDIDIPSRCFQNCGNLERVITTTTNNIGYSAFSNCVNLTEVPVTNELTTIYGDAFNGCSKLTNLMLSDGGALTTIDYNAFKNCTSVTMVSLPATIETINVNAFTGCTALADVYCKASTPPVIYANSFGGRENSIKLHVTNPTDYQDNTNWSKFLIVTLAKVTLSFYVNGVIFKDITDWAGTKITKANPKDSLEAALLDEGDIKEEFSGWDKAFPETMPSTDTRFDGYVTTTTTIDHFKYSLRPAQTINEIAYGNRAVLLGAEEGHITQSNNTVTVPETVTNCEGTYNKTAYPVVAIADNAFENQGELANVELTANITELGVSAFKGCSKLESINLTASNVTELSENIFQNCTALSFAEIPNKITSIGKWALSNTGCSNVTIPATITTMGDEVFKDCKSLETVTFADGFGLALPQMTFLSCGALKNVTLVGTMGSIGIRAFDGCGSLTTVYIPQGIERVGKQSFQNCNHLTNVTLPSTITQINEQAFKGCSTLAQIVVEATTPPTTYSNSFDNTTYQNAKLFVPTANKAAYDAAAPWQSFINLKANTTYQLKYMKDGQQYGEIEYKKAGENITPRAEPTIEGHEFSGWEGVPNVMPDSNVVITGKFKYTLSYVKEGSLEHTLPPAKELWYGDEIVLPTSLKWAGHLCTTTYNDSPVPENFTMPANDVVITVNYQQSEQETTIDNINYKVVLLEVQSVAPHAEVIESPNKTGNVDIPASITYNNHTYPVTIIQDNAFNTSNSRNIKGLTLSSGLTKIGARAFRDCRFTQLIIPATVKQIGNEAFLYCTTLNNVTFEPNSELTELPNGAFQSCSSLGAIVWPDGLETIGGSAFAACSALTSVEFPASLQAIGDYAFSGSTEIANVTLKSTELPIANKTIFDDEVYGNAKLSVPEGTNIDDEPWSLFPTPQVGGGTGQCATPTIKYDKGTLKFECTDEGATIVSEVKDTDIKKSTAADMELELTKKYTITAYAKKSGMSWSGIVTATITWRNGKPEFEGFTSVTMDDPVTKKGDINEDGSITANDASLILQHVAKKHTENVTWDDENY